ncbi:hypothetical protein D9Q98_002829 [Chlorella vulgaris]|uniref:Uncharacterized protein n=1 Tax=Chlorella vulgaris TaxID=3077 RepID=A0A9D4YZN3_CHLVU|nr:hypothetical protein D9Q98_002829 [Chlorella vulgaris]
MSESCTAGVPAARVASPCRAVAAVAALGVAVLAGVTALVLAQQAHAHVVLAIELVLVVSVTMLRVRPWAQAHPWTAVAARLVAAMASRFAPVHLPAWPHAAVAPVIGLLASTEALFLLCLTIVLPLSLGRHLWVQALSLNLALTRLRPLSLHTLALGRGQQCETFVKHARAAVAAVVTGASAQLPTPTPEQQCWMLHAWAVAVVGHLLPAVVHLAVWQCTRRLQQQGVPGAAVQLARSIRTRQRLQGSMRRQWRLQAAAEAARQLDMPDDDQPCHTCGAAARSGLEQQQGIEGAAAAAATTQTGVGPVASGHQEESGDRHNSGGPAGSLPGLVTVVKTWPSPAALALSQAPQLVQVLLLLVPAATLVWCVLEVAISAS